MSVADYDITVNERGVFLDWRGETFEIEPSDLDSGGWERKGSCDRDHCDQGDCPECPEDHPSEIGEETPRTVLERWHAEANHFGALRHCDEQPCRDLVIAMGMRW